MKRYNNEDSAEDKYQNSLKDIRAWGVVFAIWASCIVMGTIYTVLRIIL